VHTRSRRNPSWPLALAVGGCFLLAGCAQFDDSAAGQTFAPAPQLTPQGGPTPQLPGQEGGPSGAPGGGAPPSSTSIPPPQGCTDFDKAVIATCLDSVSAVAAIQGDGSTPSAFAAERRSGRILQATSGKPAAVFATVPVSATGDGGLTGLALSPDYTEDQLLFAYITTDTDNRVVRLAKGQPAKPVLTGIPKGPTGNSGSLASDGKGALLVATGDAGNPNAAADPGSLAGKVLRINTSGQPATGNPVADSAVVASGLHSPGGMCQSADGARLWVTDRLADKDALYHLQLGKPLPPPAWTWPDKPGVAGCADFTGYVAVATSTAGNLQDVPIAPDGSVTGKPSATNTSDGKSGRYYGRLAGMSLVNAQLAVAGTVNKDGGKPVSSDDRVVLIPLDQSQTTGSKD
jgi:glucose/arabinose dehydrogenase